MPKGTREAINAMGLCLNPTSITPDDIAANLNEHDIISVGVAGDLEVTPLGGDTDVAGDKQVIPVQAGFNPIPVIKIWNNSTTATGIFGYEQG